MTQPERFVHPAILDISFLETHNQAEKDYLEYTKECFHVEKTYGNDY